MSDSAEDPASRNQNPGFLDLRHLSAFQQVYLTRDYTAAGHDLNINRKGIVRMLERLEQTFQSRLFTSQTRNHLDASPFADRLFNDLRFLNSARKALQDQVAEIRASGRLLRVGSSPAIFRTEIFRTIFRALQTSERVRTSYVPIKSGDASKALAAGVCDIHIGCWSAGPSRFAGELIGGIGYGIMVKNGDPVPASSIRPYVVTLDGSSPDTGPSGAEASASLDDAKFLRWLDHPEECPAGTRILAPDIPRDPVHWTTENDLLDISQPIRIQYLRQHPYEFLPALVNGLKSRISRK